MLEQVYRFCKITVVNLGKTHGKLPVNRRINIVANAVAERKTLIVIKTYLKDGYKSVVNLLPNRLTLNKKCG